ncbi:DinB family protein [Spirosoma rhododendri]|uniref:DinB family protein n=1 Tax=Spirosoma rhododendri TaxID=2728024 RepID=A0A7L5DPL8_9BACT|nr:DinB family protein [Spirosoma rhododendri]QJD78448.1 DinB family protein [Spirosoma rhododendri]
MQKQLLLDMLAQSQTTCWSSFDTVTPENGTLRLNQQAASAGFILRHTGEMFMLFGHFFGLPTTVQNTTMRQQDTGQGEDIAGSRQLIEQGYERFRAYIDQTPDSAWLDPIDTPFFGTVSRMRLFSHVLYHNAYHAGQIGLTIVRGQQF